MKNQLTLQVTDEYLDQFVTRRELREELARFGEELRQAIISEFREILMDVLQLQREYFDKKFKESDKRFEILLSQNAIDHNNFESRLRVLETDIVK